MKDSTENDKAVNEMKQEPITEAQESGAVKLKEDGHGLEDIQEHEEEETPNLSKETSYKVGDAEDIIEPTQKQMADTSKREVKNKQG